MSAALLSLPAAACRLCSVDDDDPLSDLGQVDLNLTVSPEPLHMCGILYLLRHHNNHVSACTGVQLLSVVDVPVSCVGPDSGRSVGCHTHQLIAP